MAKSVSQVVSDVRTLMRDRALSDALFNTFEITYHVCAEAERLFQEIGIGPSWEDGVISITPDTYEYSLPVSSGLLESVIAIRLHSRNWPIEKITNEELEAMRRGPSISKSFPMYVAMFESSDQSTKFRFWPIPSEADSIDWLRSKAPVWSASPLADTIPLSDPAIRVLEMRVAKRLMLQIPQDALNNRLAAKDLIPQLDRDIADGIRLERSRINRLKRTGRMSRREA